MAMTIGEASGTGEDDVLMRGWYPYGWIASYRPEREDVATLAANLQIQGCENNNVRYSQADNQGYWRQLKSNGYDPTKIKTLCYTDCYAFCCANLCAACHKLGLLEGDAELAHMSYTGNSDDLMLSPVNAKKFTDSPHLDNSKLAKRGDVYLSSGHAMMCVGDGKVSDSLGSGSGSGGTGYDVHLNIEATSPYFIGVPETARVFDGDLYKDNRVSGVLLKAGQLYDKSHNMSKHYISKNLLKQVECAEAAGLSYGVYAEVRAHTMSEAKLECEQLYYVLAATTPPMSVWLHLDMHRSVKTNEKILDYYLDQLTRWGFGKTCGLYVKKDELEKQITWKKYKDKFYWWLIDHNQDIDKWTGYLAYPK